MNWRLDHGYYVYQGRYFTDKLQAISFAHGRGDQTPDISFRFNDAAYARADIEPQESLDELYRRRAQELRERYGQLILMYSGGADSTQMLMTFLRHKIPLDEIRCYQALGFIERLGHGKVGDGLDLLREYRRHVVPVLRAVQQQSPHTRINVIDTTACYTDRQWNDAVAYETAIWPRPLNPLFMGLKRDFEAFDLQVRVDKLGAGVAVVYGVDKPSMRFVGNRLNLFFSDLGRAGLYTVFAQKGVSAFDYEMFYWGSPAITIKQAHVVRRALECNPAALAHIRRTRCNVYLDTGIPGIDLSLIYPDWRRQITTKERADDPRMISSFIDAPVIEMAALRRKMVEDLFRDGRTDDYVSRTQSKLHYIGTIDALQASPNLDKDERRPISPAFD